MIFPSLASCDFSLRYDSNCFVRNSHCMIQAPRTETSMTLNPTMPNSNSTMPSRNTLKKRSIRISTTRRGNGAHRHPRRRRRLSLLLGVCGADVLLEFEGELWSDERGLNLFQMSLTCILVSFFLSRSVCLVRGVAIGLVAVLGGWVGRFVDTSWDIFILVGQEEQVCLFP